MSPAALYPPPLLAGRSAGSPLIGHGRTRPRAGPCRDSHHGAATAPRGSCDAITVLGPRGRRCASCCRRPRKAARTGFTNASLEWCCLAIREHLPSTWVAARGGVGFSCDTATGERNAGAVTAFHGRRLLESVRPVGYAAVRDRYRLPMPLPRRPTATAGRHRPSETQSAGTGHQPRRCPRPQMAGGYGYMPTPRLEASVATRTTGRAAFPWTDGRSRGDVALAYAGPDSGPSPPRSAARASISDTTRSRSSSSGTPPAAR